MHFILCCVIVAAVIYIHRPYFQGEMRELSELSVKHHQLEIGWDNCLLDCVRKAEG